MPQPAGHPGGYRRHRRHRRRTLPLQRQRARPTPLAGRPLAALSAPRGAPRARWSTAGRRVGGCDDDKALSRRVEAAAGATPAKGVGRLSERR